MPEVARRRRPSWRWFVPAALLALMPKCPLCVVAWLLAGVGFSLNRPQFCGVPPNSGANWQTWLPTLIAAAAAAAFLLRAKLGSHKNTPSPEPDH